MIRLTAAQARALRRIATDPRGFSTKARMGLTQPSLRRLVDAGLVEAHGQYTEKSTGWTVHTYVLTRAGQMRATESCAEVAWDAGGTPTKEERDRLVASRHPSGFTHEDVALLGDLAMIAGTPMYGEMARSLAARIAALLPPATQSPNENSDTRDGAPSHD